MSRIRSRDTKPELAVKAVLDGAGIPYEREPDLPGRPDFLLPRTNLVVFVDGDFWHGRNLERDLPRWRSEGNEFWIRKITRNVERDTEVDTKLKEMGYVIRRVWGSDVMERA